MTSTASWAEHKKPLGLSLGITALVWILLFTVVIFDPNTHSTASLQESKDISPPTAQVCPVTTKPLLRRAQQVHVTLWTGSCLQL